MLSPVIEKQCLGAALALVVATARTDRVHSSPIRFWLRMCFGVAVNFAGGSLENGRAYPFRESEHVNGTMHTRFGRLHGIMLVVDGRCRAGQIVNFVDLDIERESHVVPQDFEAGICQQMGYVAFPPRE